MSFDKKNSTPASLGRRDFLKAVGSVAVFASGTLGLGDVFAGKNKKAKPNILFIITDQQFADAISCVDSRWIKTPGMDSIAKNGVRFPNAYVNLPVCLPQRYSMFTGRIPCTRKQADPNNKPMISLGNQAKKAGYDTAFFGKWHIQDQTFERGDTAYSGFDVNEAGRDISSTDKMIKYLSQKKTKPFLAVASYYNPHDICEWGRKKAGRKKSIKMSNGDVEVNPPLAECPPLPDNYVINSDESEAVTVRRSLTDDKGVPNAQCMAMSFTEGDWRQYRWAYNRLVELADKQVSRLLKALDDNGLADNTVIIFTSDHGDGIGAHRWHQKSILYEESCRVPFIISYPGKVRKNETDDRLISVGIDMMATISDIAGVNMPQGPYYGKSALPFVLDAKSKAPTHQYVVSEAAVSPKSGKEYQGRAIRTSEFKYHVWSRGKNREQLFDIVNDPGETKNLAADPAYASELNKHRQLFADWLNKTDDTYPQKPKDKLHVYLFIGQSNMAGRAPFTEEESGVIPRCFLLDSEDKWKPAKNPLNRYSTIRKGIGMQKMDPGFTFAKTILTEEPGISLGLVVNAKGGTRIEQWAKGTEFYNEAVRRARIAMADGTLKGILWHQGESNSKNPESYLSKLKSLVEDLRNDLGILDLPFVAGQVFYNAKTKPNTRQINEQIAKLPETLRLTGYVSSEGLTTIDNTHFDSKGMKLLGQRYARQIQKLTKKSEK